MDDRLVIYTLGGVHILLGDNPIQGLSNRKAEALLIYLASLRRPLPREVLADLLWDERTQTQSLGNLRVVLTMLRQTLGKFLIIDRDTVSINPAVEVWLDAAQLEAGLHELHRQGRLSLASVSDAVQALELYRGDFLQGFSVSDCRQFEEWQVRERERLHQLAIDGYSELVDYDLDHRDYQLGTVHAARLLELDPLMESAHRLMMLVLARSGQRAAAINQYHKCQELLQAELGVQPDDETINLFEQIKTGALGEEETPEGLPSGTVTFLFTDIEGSTILLERLRDQYAHVLSEHHMLLREVFEHWHGYEVDTQGDAFFVAFARATDAIGCAIEAQQRLSEHRWPQGVVVKVRMAMHTGEPLIAHTGYVGMDVHRAARIAHVGYGGQVLLSQTTRDLVCLTLPPGTRLRDLGAHLLKDIRFPQQIFQLEIPGLPNEFPPLMSLDRLEKEEAPPDPGISPYMGMQFFDEKDAEWFFGRQAITGRLVQAVRSAHFLAVVGASGSGKSSVVRAGLIPAIRTSYPAQFLIKVITPSSHPLESLSISLTQGLESVTATATLIDDMQINTHSLHLYCKKNLIPGKDSRLLLLIDQFEELFTLCRSDSERDAFVKNFLYAVGIPDSVVTAVITLRADFYAHLAQYTGLRELVSAHQVYIGAMNTAELRAAIEEPARRGGWELTPGLVDLILSDLGAGENIQPEPGALPLLSHALLETWKRRRGSLMNLKAYTEAGGVRGAIARTAESVFYRDLSPEEQVVARGIFLRLTELGEGTQDTRRRISITELIPPGPAVDAAQIQAVLVKLADARLIVTGEGMVEVAHEALIREWPTLREWLKADREALLLHRHLTEAAQEWELMDRDPGALYRGTRLNQALEWALTNPRQLNQQEQAYLDASREASEREQADLEATRLRELEAAKKLAEIEKSRAKAESQRAEEQERSAKRLRRRAWMLGGALVLALILAAIAGAFWRQVDIKGREANSRYLNSAALSNLVLNPQLSAHLALQAMTIYPENTFEVENTLHQVLPELRLLSTTPITITRPSFINPEATIYLRRQGERLIHTTPQGIEVFDSVSGRRFVLAAGYTCAALFPSRDGSWVAALCAESGQSIDPLEAVYEAQVWEVDTQQKLFTLPDVPGEFMLPIDYPTMGVIPPSRDQPLRVWAGTFDLAIHLWEVPSGREILLDRYHTGIPEIDWVDEVVSPDNKYLATFGSDGLVVLWDLENNAVILQFDGRSAGLWADFSPDGTRLAIAGDDQSIRIWNLTSLPAEPWLENRITFAGITLVFMLYSPDGGHLVAGGQDGYVRIWNTQSGELELTLSGHGFNHWPLSYSSDGRRLFTTSTIEIMEWDLSPKHEVLTLSGRIGSAPYSPDGKRLALLGADHTLSIVDSQTGEVVVPAWQAHTDWIEDVAWSPDGERLVTCSGNFNDIKNDNSARIWDASTGQLLKHLPVDGGYHLVAWSPDGSRLVSSNFDSSTASIWDTSSWDLANTHLSPDADFALAISSDGQKIATSSMSALAVWNTISGNDVFTYTTVRTSLSLAFSPDGRHLAAGLTSGDILIFNITENGIEKQEPGVAGGDSVVWSLAFSPNGSLLAAGDGVGMIRVWEVESRQRQLELQAFSDPVKRVAFSPDGNRLLASMDKGITNFYVLPLEELTGLVRSRLILPLTAEECREYLNTATCPP